MIPSPMTYAFEMQPTHKEYNMIPYERKPEIGDLLERSCGSMGIVVQITPAGSLMRVQIICTPEHKSFASESLLWVPLELLGVTWKHVA